MTSHLFALGNRATRITAVAAVVFTAALIANPTRAHAAGPTSAPVLKQGMGMGVEPSTRVRQMQRALDRRGYSLGAAGVDGRFGPFTAAAVRRFQARHRLAVDGVVGRATRGALRIGRVAARRARTDSAKRHRPNAAPQPSTTARAQQSGPKPATPQPKAATPQPKAATEQRKAATDRPKAATPQSKPTAGSPTRTTQDDKPAAGSRSTAPAAPAATTDPADDWRTPIAMGAAAALLVAVLSALGMRLARRRTHHRPAPPSRPAAGARVTAPDHGTTAGAGTPAATPLSTPQQPAAQRRRLSLVEGPGRPDLTFVRGNGHGPPLPPRARVIGYARPAEGPEANAGRSPARTIEEACAGQGWELVAVLHDRGNGHRPRRPPLISALERVAAGEAAGVVVSDVDHVHRSIGSGSALAEWLAGADATLVAHELASPGTTSGGRAPVALIRLDGRPSLQKRGLG